MYLGRRSFFIDADTGVHDTEKKISNKDLFFGNDWDKMKALRSNQQRNEQSAE